jgi:hypothetical protein
LRAPGNYRSDDDHADDDHADDDHADDDHADDDDAGAGPRGTPGVVVSQLLRIGVPASLLELPPDGGHGKVWNRVLRELERSERVVALPDVRRPRLAGRMTRRPRLDVVLASGHDDLPPADVPVVVQVHEAGWSEPELRDSLDNEFLAQIESR